MSAMLLTSFIRLDVTNCITLPVKHMVPSDSRFYLEKLSQLIITAASHFKHQFYDELFYCLSGDFHQGTTPLFDVVMLLYEQPAQSQRKKKTICR